jgi:hypothetical protein
MHRLLLAVIAAAFVTAAFAQIHENYFAMGFLKGPNLVMEIQENHILTFNQFQYAFGN